MHGVGLEIPLSNWFTFRVLPTTVPPDYIKVATADTTEDLLSSHALAIWPGHAPKLAVLETIRGWRASQQRESVPKTELTFARRQDNLVLELLLTVVQWLIQQWPQLSLNAPEPLTIQQVRTTFEHTGLGNFVTFSKPMTGPTGVWQDYGWYKSVTSQIIKTS